MAGQGQCDSKPTSVSWSQHFCKVCISSARPPSLASSFTPACLSLLGSSSRDPRSYPSCLLWGLRRGPSRTPLLGWGGGFSFFSLAPSSIKVASGSQGSGWAPSPEGQGQWVTRVQPLLSAFHLDPAVIDVLRVAGGRARSGVIKGRLNYAPRQPRGCFRKVFRL